MTDLERNKKAVTSFYDLAFNQCKPREAIERYAGDVYIQHNPEVADGKEAFIAYFVFRLDRNGKIVEHWDVLQVVPKTADHSNSMF